MAGFARLGVLITLVAVSQSDLVIARRDGQMARRTGMRSVNGGVHWVFGVFLALSSGAGYFLFVPPALPSPTPLDMAASVAFPLYVNTDDGTKRACTGFYVKPLAVNAATGEPLAGWVLTAGHCVVRGVVTRATDVASYEEGHPAVGSWTAGYDFGLLELSEYGPLRSRHTYLPLLDRPLAAGERVFVLGFGRGQLRNVVGTYTGTDEMGLRITTLEAVRGGMSGSPVLTTDGKVAGILVATRCKGPYVPGIGCDDDAYDATATPVSHVLEALRVLEPRFFEPPMVIGPRQY